ncbi:hypothetical protein EFK69_12860 [Lactococcus lactis subsp. lactis]|nr:hypothetical protein [Lactococcus lactis subsp. lactis]
MTDSIVIQLLSIVLLMLIVFVIAIDLTLKNKIKPAIILLIILGLLCIVELWIMLSHGLIPHGDNIIPKK